MCRRSVLGLLLAASIASVTPSARADGPAAAASEVPAPPAEWPAPAAPAQPVLVTVSGGVSLGAYEAGALYVLGEIFKRGTPRRQVVLATSASAGSVNAFTTALSACAPPNPDPTRDPGWVVWIDVGFDELFLPREVSAPHVFSDRA